MITEEDFEDLKQAFEDLMKRTYPQHVTSVGVTYDGWNLYINFEVDAIHVDTIEMSGVRHLDLAYTILSTSIRSFVAGMTTHALVH